MMNAENLSLKRSARDFRMCVWFVYGYHGSLLLLEGVHVLLSNLFFFVSAGVQHTLFIFHINFNGFFKYVNANLQCRVCTESLNNESSSRIGLIFIPENEYPKALYSLLCGYYIPSHRHMLTSMSTSVMQHLNRPASETSKHRFF